MQLPDRRAKRPGSVKDFGTLAHEITHKLLQGMEYSTPLPGPAPTRYGRHDRTEHIAELGAAEHTGGGQAFDVPETPRSFFSH